MLTEKDSDILRIQLSNNAEREHYEAMCLAAQKQDYNIIAMLGLAPHKDGEQWYFLFGSDMMNGVSGFGETPYKAMIDFNQNWHKQ